MNNRLASIVAVASAMVISSCATSKKTDLNAPTGPPSATVVFEGGTAAYWASAAGGTGTLNYKGKEYPFSGTAAGAGGSGAQKVSATGEVYNLNALSDFPGTYTQVSSGFTIIKGTKKSKLTNSKGVVIYVEAKTSGLASSTGTAKLVIDLK